jgi:phosphoesterase RecJ-like protein
VGAAAGMLELFAQLGAEARLHVADGEKVPYETSMLPEGAVVRRLPAQGVPLYALDCGARDRVALPLRGWEGFIVNIDHHHDNTGYGDLVLLRPQASSTCDIVCDIARALDLAPRPPAARALYAGISFDSGHFRHSSTSAGTFMNAAWLSGLGVDVTSVYEQLYEGRSLASLRLWGRAVATTATIAGGRGLLSTVAQRDFDEAGATPDETEGIVESLRSVSGVEVAAVVREQQGEGPRVRVSLRSDRLDVSAIAALMGGGGHRLAAGFSSDDSPEEVTAWLSSELARRLSTASC